MTYQSQIAIINALAEIQFKNFCTTFFQTLGLSNINSVLVMQNGVVTGKGAIELGIVKSYHFAFLAKQHTGAVSNQLIQELRDSMDSDTDKGIVLTTGYFTREAKRQAKTRGKIPIDLIDGNNLTQRLRRYNLSISAQTGETLQLAKEKTP
ncbi:MAG: restriction endonuclease [Alphaproteobacteria bacterium]|nr:restriction endonuclease [Alphaproteobacteria bacterium]